MFNLRKLIGFDPFDFFAGHSSESENQKSNYKITLKLHSLNKILKKKFYNRMILSNLLSSIPETGFSF
ncbi:hypothetical protein LEP1GSC043_0304 [Leptospira weilii str. Ecochallenge]|uniref:Uncharacterized protein n=2 Tax=Leptospira weilii TaxID=28184 RepID=N1U9R6_9LEPT|nr:hypothetical protein LEP1GSC038_0092 [Leptospira weilii str. 2006001855]EMY14936.1 hypothetical protein LEP1GSC043_0304 [Leptospira weilii str. Ecochallenge]